MNELTVEQTPIPGLLVLRLPVHGDSRGWFKENWQRARMTALGLPDFGPVQHNVSFNAGPTTRGFHAEPWDKLVSVATGRVFGAWTDLREGPTFGHHFTTEIGPDVAVFVPRGVANAFQSLEPGTAYTYLVNDHWDPQDKTGYVFVALDDPQLDVSWPIPLDRTERSRADLNHPPLAEVSPLPAARTVVIGSTGQLGQALRAALPTATFLSRAECDLSSPDALGRLDWTGVDTIIDAAAYTAVDEAETPGGRRAAWATNVDGVRRLVDLARDRRITLVQVSSDYVFDGEEEVHDEAEPFAPLNVYGATKAAGDEVVATLPRHYIVRTSWVVGAGKNFVSTMVSLAERGICPAVVDDQWGRLTSADDLAAGILHLLQSRAPYGTYNLSGNGPVKSWAQIAADIFEMCGRDRAEVHPVSTAEYTRDKATASRPRHGTLALDKITATGFVPADPAYWLPDLVASLRKD